MQATGDDWRRVNGAWVHPEARLGEGVSLEPAVVIGAGVEIGAGSWIGAGAVIHGPTVLGRETQVHPTAVLGAPPLGEEDKPEASRLVAGDRNVFREGVVAMRGSPSLSGVTRIGSGCFFMAMSHMGPDCVIGNNVIFANDVYLPRGCSIGDNVNIGGGAGLVQFLRVGRFSFLGGISQVTEDCVPFTLFDGGPALPKGINIVGLRRGQFPHATLLKLKEAFRVLFTGTVAERGDVEEARAEIERRGALCDEVEEMLEFLRVSRAQPTRPSGVVRVKLTPEVPPER